MTVVCVQKNDCVWYCVQRPQFHLLFNNEHNTKYILFVESRHCTVKLKISFFLPNDAALISICNPSSEKGKLPLLVCWRLTPFQMYFVWLFLNGSSLMYCVKTSSSPSSLSCMTEAMSTTQHDGERADWTDDSEVRWGQMYVSTERCLS